MKTLSVSYSPGTLSGLMAPRPAATTTTAAAVAASVQKMKQTHAVQKNSSWKQEF